MRPVNQARQTSAGTARDAIWGQLPGGQGSRLGTVLRVAAGLVAGVATEGLGSTLVTFPLASRLEPWCVLNLVVGVLLGPAGLLGSAMAYMVVNIPEIPRLLSASINAGAYLLVGGIAYAVFRLVPGLDRGLGDLRSYIGFLGLSLFGSLVLAGIGSANLFLRTMGSDAFWAGVVYWFSSAFTSLLIVAPLILMVASWKHRPWLVAMPGERTRATAGIKPALMTGDPRRATRHDIAFGVAMVLATTAVVSPLVHLRPRFGGWFALLYLVPILWGSINRGLRGGVLVASGSAVAYLVGSAISSLLLVREVTHDEILGQFAGLVIFSLVGAITGAFQQARLEAESALLRSNLELERRHESLALVNRLADRLRRTLDVDTVAQEAVKALVELRRRPMVAVYLLDDDGATLVLKAQDGFDEAILAQGRTLSVESSLSGIAISNREPLISHDISSDERIDPSMGAHLAAAGFESVVSIPLVFEQQAHGAINLVYRDKRTVAYEDLESYSTIGRTVALALVNARHVARLEHLAFHDVLTGLPNREGFRSWFLNRLPSPTRDHRKLALVIVDIDRFKEVNDALGHHVGDQVLVQIGPRIASVSTPGALSVFRMGGDAFAAILPDLGHEAESETWTRDLLAALAAPFEVSGMVLEIEASAGIAIFPDDASDSSELLRCADVAVNHAKRTSRPIARYSRDLDLHTPERLALASELGGAIRDNQLTLHFQPKVTLVDGRPIGFEALVRWQHPAQGLLPPDRFIPLAEVGELIHPLTYWVVETALEQLKAWQQREPALTMAINLSARNILDRSCAGRLKRAMDEAHIDPTTVEFELTETALIIDPEAAAATLSGIAASGARVVIDDFGTGYSSMVFLKRCPIHALKIDRSFVRDMLSDLQSRAIVRATVQLAHDLGLSVVAEGVEDADTVDALREMGCHEGQGFYFLRPSPAEEVDHRMAGWGIGL